MKRGYVVLLLAGISLGIIAEDTGGGCAPCASRKVKAARGRDPHFQIGGMGQGAVAARGILINAQGVPTNIIKASLQAKSFSAREDVAQQLTLYLKDTPAPSSGTTHKSEPPHKYPIGGKDYYLFFNKGRGEIVTIDNYVPYRLAGTLWQPWPQFWALWPWWWGYSISPGLPSCYDCEKLSCPYGWDCPPECKYCEIGL